MLSLVTGGIDVKNKSILNLKAIFYNLYDNTDGNMLVKLQLEKIIYNVPSAAGT